MRATLIVNPFASRVTESGVRALEQALRPVETLRTERCGHATELARAASGDTVYVYGGDGVINEVLNGLAPGVSLGLVPGGHTNVFARALGIPRNPKAAVECRRARRISLGRVNGRRFAFASGIGVDSEAVREMETIKRARDGRRPGDVAYAQTVMRRLLGGYEPRLEIAGFGRAALLFVSNDVVFTYAGLVPLRFSPPARFELGLDLAAPVRVAKPMLPGLLARVVAGRGLAGVRDILVGHDLDRIEVVCDRPLPLQADGEDLGDVTEAVFEAERDAVSVLVR